MPISPFCCCRTGRRRIKKVLHADRCPDDGIVSISVRPAGSLLTAPEQNSRQTSRLTFRFRPKETCSDSATFVELDALRMPTQTTSVVHSFGIALKMNQTQTDFIDRI